MVISVTTPFLRRTGYVFVGLLLGLTHASCDLIISPDCGPSQDLEDAGPRTSLAAWDTFVDGGMRFYVRTLKVENVCPNEHVSANFLLKLNSNPTLPITLRGRLEFGDPGPAILFAPATVEVNSEDVPFEDPGHTLIARTELGMKQAYGDNPGSYYVVLQIFFPTTGGENRDLNYILDTISEAEGSRAWVIESRYFEYPD